jgi:hypothetical protein
MQLTSARKARTSTSADSGNLNYLPQSAIAGLTPDEIGAERPSGEPFFYDRLRRERGVPCVKTHFICDPTSPLAGPTVSQAQLLVPFPQYTSFSGDSPPIANSIYHALQVRVEREFANGLQFLVTYTWSKSIDNASATDDSISWLGGGTTDGGTITVQNPFDLHAERAPFCLRHSARLPVQLCLRTASRTRQTLWQPDASGP